MAEIRITPKGRRIKQQKPRARAKSAVTASPRTIAFKEKIQRTLSLSGITVNKNLAWQIYKDMFYATVEFTVNDSEHRLPLSGVGTFSVRESVPRRGKSEEYNFVPRFKVKPSSRINALLEAAMPECRKENTAETAAPVAEPKAKKVAKKAKDEPAAEATEETKKTAALKAPKEAAKKKPAPAPEPEEDDEDDEALDDLLEDEDDEDDVGDDDDDADDDDADDDDADDFDFEG